MRALVEPPPSTRCALCGGELRLKLIESANQILDLVNNIYVCAKCGREKTYTMVDNQYAATSTVPKCA